MTEMHVREEVATVYGPDTITYGQRTFSGVVPMAELLTDADLEGEASWTFKHNPDVTAVKTILVVDGVDIAEHGPVSR